MAEIQTPEEAVTSDSGKPSFMVMFEVHQALAVQHARLAAIYGGQEDSVKDELMDARLGIGETLVHISKSMKLASED